MAVKVDHSYLWRYRWDDAYTNGDVWVGLEGDDYEKGKVAQFRNFLRERARNSGMKVKTKGSEHEGVAGLAFQFLPKDASEE
jgi:hypothetical protein